MLHVLILLFIHCSLSKDIYTDITNKQVTRNIDLTSQLSRHSVEVTVENTGGKSTISYYFTLEKHLTSKLSYLRAFTMEDKELEVQLDNSIADDNAIFYRVTLPRSLDAGGVQDIKISLIFTHVMTPFPEQITQSERQLVRFIDNNYWYSVYQTESVKTKVKLPSTSVQSSSDLSPSSVKGDIATYGPYKNIKPFSRSDLTLHFENNKPFITVSNVIRTFEISHWGNIAVQEIFELRHDGAKLKGPFSRYDFQINTQANSQVGQAAVPSLKIFLPPEAKDVYYRDDIGNISTSNLRPDTPKQVFEFRPRFPLFGGWKTSFTIGYSLPSSPFLSTDASDSSKFIFNMNYLTDWDFSVVIDHQEFQVILPEGSSNVESHIPFETGSQILSKTYTYLDVSWIGRPVITISQNNLVNEHNQNIAITYSFASSYMWLEPLLLISIFFGLFGIAIFIIRMRFYLRIYDEQPFTHPKTTKKGLELFSNIFNERNSIHERLDNQLHSYLSSSNAEQWKTAKKQAKNDLENLTKKANSCIAEIPEEDVSAVSNKLQSLERLQQQRAKLQDDLHDLLIEFKAEGQINKAKFEAKIIQLQSFYEETSNDIEEEMEKLLGAN